MGRVRTFIVVAAAAGLIAVACVVDSLVPPITNDAIKPTWIVNRIPIERSGHPPRQSLSKVHMAGSGSGGRSREDEIRRKASA